jgi:hypothetical protein
MIENGTSNYFERGEHAIHCHGNFSDPLYVKICPMMLDPNDDMQWHTFVCYDLFIYKMPMHGKKVRLHCCFLCFVLLYMIFHFD